MEAAYCPYCMERLGDIEGPCPHCGNDPLSYTALPHHLPPETVLQDRYVVGRALGEGGFGITYVGLDKVLGLKVAIKEYFPSSMAVRDASVSLVITGRYGGSIEGFDQGMEHFLSEARVMARMDKQRAIVGVRDFFEANGTAYIVMEFVEGITLLNYAKSLGGRIEPDELFPMLEPLFKALGALHAEGLLHRDISPDNIMLENGIARLIDFGCAREGTDGSKTMTVILKYDYAPIEQYNQKGQGPWTDVYALAATIYRCLCGQAPLRAVERLTGDSLIPPTAMGVALSPAQERGLLKALALRVSDRTKTMMEFHDDLYLADGATAVHQIDTGWRKEARPDTFETVTDGNDSSPDDTWSQEGFTVLVGEDQGNSAASPHEGHASGYTFMGQTYEDNAQLAYELAHDWKSARRHLFAHNLERHFISIGDNDLSSMLYEIVENHMGSYASQDVGLAKAIWCIAGGTTPLIWRGKDVSPDTLASTFVASDLNSLSAYDDLLASDLLSWYLDQHADAEQHAAANTMRDIEGAAEKDVSFARHLFLHLFAQGGKSPWAGSHDFESLATSLLASPYAVYQLVQQKEALDDALAALAPYAARLGTLETLVKGRFELDGIKDARSFDRIPRQVAKLLEVMDAVADGSATARWFASTYGPQAAWLWVARNTALYRCDVDQQGQTLNRVAQNALKQLSLLAEDNSDPLPTIVPKEDRAAGLCTALFKAMDANPLPDYLGYNGGATVHALHIDALPCASFYGNTVPRGFVGSLLAASPETEHNPWNEVELLSESCRKSVLTDEGFVRACATDSAQSEEDSKAPRNPIRSAVLNLAGLVLSVFVLSGKKRNHWVLKQTTDALVRLGLVEGPIMPETAVTLARVGIYAYFILQIALAAFEVFVSRTDKSSGASTRNLVEQGRDEISQFALGTSKLAQQLADKNWNGPLEPLNLVSQVQDISKKSDKLKQIISMPWYPVVWHLTTIAPALLAGCIVFSYLVGKVNGPIIDFLKESSPAQHYDIKAATVMAKACCESPLVPLGFLASFAWATIGTLNKKKGQRTFSAWLGIIVRSVIYMAIMSAIVVILVLIAASKNVS